MFTNWLTPPPTSSMPPDVVIEVGPPPITRFAAHSALLAVHSGYLRAAFRTEDGHLKRYETPLYLPNITADQFSPLLSYMYTGFLDLTIDNIFGVLLATHVLHMPRSLELCRSFLARTQAEGYLGGANLPTTLAPEKMVPSKVIRPIASRAAETGLRFIAPPTSHVLLATTGTPFKSIHQLVERPRSRSRSPIPSTSVAPASKTSPVPKKVKLIKRSHEKVRRRSDTKIVSLEAAAPPVLVTDVKGVVNEEEKVIIDIASCDGPVRFCRVLNDAYGGGTPITSSHNTPSSHRNHQTMNTSFHQQMARNISERRVEVHSSAEEESENSQDNCQKPPNPGTSGSTGEIFTCVYCNHTFKSQYCYQKHAKRHLNPLHLDSTDSNTSSTVDDKSPAPSIIKVNKNNLIIDTNSNQISKREVRPLDMNVQYYPCKTCGSKFPSYYFVHKHRKMCHAEEEAMASQQPVILPTSQPQEPQ